MIALQNIIKTYVMGDQIVRALAGVSLTIASGEYVAIMGTSGSGKSTLMNILGCLDVPTSGVYMLDGLPVSSYDDAALSRIRNQKLGFVFQQFNLMPRLTARKNVELPLAYAQVPTAERGVRAAEALERVGLGARQGHKPLEMSGGQQQRVAIARAIVNNPSLLLADEPTGALDSRTSDEIMALFTDLHAGGMTVVLVTHEPDVAAYAHRILRFRDGLLVSDEPNQPVTPRKTVVG